MNDPWTAPNRTVTPLHTRAISDIGLIRDAMERATQFTALPGWWMSAIGGFALPVALLASRIRLEQPATWLALWLSAAVVAFLTGLVATRAKARRLGLPLVTRPYRRFLVLFGAPLAAGGVLTPVLWRSGGADSLPGLWLLLYGVGLTAGGLLTVPAVAWTGAAFMGLGTLAVLIPAPDLMMGLGFGGLHLVLGTIIGRRHGG